MSRERADFDLGGFAPKAPAASKDPDALKIIEGISREKGFTPRTPDAAPPVRAEKEREIRMPVSMKESLSRWLKEEAIRRKSSSRAIIMEALRAIGAPIDDDDIRDRRKS
jgi:hypothetical protein